MKVFGFSATVVREPGFGYAARIKELHANTQAKGMKELERNLREVAKLMILDVLAHEKQYSKSTVSKAKSVVMRALA
ncbi:MAG: hypothetical protein KGH66_02715 [Candidatus Micrarchaeota archaeon]|nr:hypothetical protein [Candidatus Micrarchaeota archaeon]